MHRNVNAVGGVLPDLVAQGAHRHPEHAGGAGAIAAAAFDGVPQFAPIAGTTLKYALNAPMPVIATVEPGSVIVFL